MTARRLALLVAPAALALLVAGCAPVTVPPSADPGAAQADPLAPFLAQQIDWRDCEDGMECARVTAPLDWDHPQDGRTAEIAVTRHRATGDRIGSLFVNPGGPGVSGYDFIRDDWSTNLSGRLAERFDIIGWDHRGVGRTTPVTCYTEPADVERWLYWTPAHDWRTDPDGWAAEREAVGRAYVEACVRGTGEALQFIDTESTVRDLDLLRALVGDDELSYIGFSNGTMIGQRYLDRFPEHVGRIVLDGVSDPALDRGRWAVEQEAGFESAFVRFAGLCPERFGADCPLPAPTEAALAWTHALLLRYDERPVPASEPGDERLLGGATIKTAISQALYDEKAWRELAEMLGELAAPTPVTDTALHLADRYNDFVRGEKLPSNFIDALAAIDCADYGAERDPAALGAQRESFAQAAPTLTLPGPAAVDLVCGYWPYPPRAEPKAIVGAGLPPILVISTTGDPATPYEWGVRVAERLESGVLVTNHGDAHTAYYADADACIRDVVDDYLISGAVPASDPNCGG